MKKKILEGEYNLKNNFKKVLKKKIKKKTGQKNKNRYFCFIEYIFWNDFYRKSKY